MSILARAAKLRHLPNFSRSISISALRHGAHNYDDFKPGPKPRTKEEYEAAAKKYNLLPSEYQPYPDDDGLGRGDYPKLPDIGTDDRDPFYPWDYPDQKRNFNEPYHAEIDYINDTRYWISMRPRYSSKQMIGTFLAIMISGFGITFLLEPYPVFRPVMEKQLPASGVVHYTFEKNDSVIDIPSEPEQNQNIETEEKNQENIETQESEINTQD